MQDAFFYIAKVTDNQDKDNLNRVKVTTMLKEESVSYWIPYLTAKAGDSFGFSSLPDIDDQVLVLSFGSSRERQFIIGSFWDSNLTPPETEENTDADLNGDGNNSLSFIKSKTGNMMIFDDTEGKEKIQLITADGKTRFELDNENSLVNLETDSDISIQAKGNIAIQTEEEISFEVKKAFGLESEDFILKGSKEINIEANKNMTIKGSSIALN